MWRKILPSMAALSLALAVGVPGAWAAAPFGDFNGLQTGGNATNGVAGLVGWALAESGVYAVDIVVDGAVVGRANYGRTRPLATKLYPNYPNSAAPGFAYELNTVLFSNGTHTVTARVESATGQVAYLNNVQILIQNVEADLPPFGKIEFPQLDAQLYGLCWTPPQKPPANPNYNIVSGYALDVNVQNEETGVGYVELLIDGAIVANSKADCVNVPAAGGLSDCYGLYRPDLLAVYPGLKDTPNSGFRFVLDVGDLLSAHGDVPPLYVPGSHQLDIRSGDIAGNVTDIASISVFFTCFDFTNEDLAIGGLDNPIPGLLYGGNVITSGWALDFEGVNAVLISVDGNLYNFAYYGLARPDIYNLYPSYPQAATSGWYSYIDTTQLSNGVHYISATVVDNNDVYTFIGKIPMTVENPQP